MSQPLITTFYPSDIQMADKIKALLQSEGIHLDANLDYTCAVVDDEYNVIATGSCFKNTLRCIAVSHDHQGEGLMNTVVSHLIGIQYQRGNVRLYLYTKCGSAKYFAELGFHEIVQIKDELVFMENSSSGFSRYLSCLRQERKEGASVASVVMNANPFTSGHRYLIEQAARNNDIVHLFIISEDASLFPFAVRKKLILAGIADLPNVAVHESGPYIISNATFPSYFQRDEESVIRGHALLDLSIFTQIAATLGITVRYVGEEPHSIVTGIYNEIMQKELPSNGIRCVVVPRKKIDGMPISASAVRKALHDGDLSLVEKLVPETTYRFLTSPEASPLIAHIQAEENVSHY
ncbi:MAG: [Oscillospiraceae bacterium]|nr:[citrate (pro-3S)-lyase] ligase [Oscillospiraceae bacterium]